MLRVGLTRLVAALSMALIGMGGGTLPVLDGLLFHSHERAYESIQAHYEAGSGCHADGCAIRSTAQLVRSASPIPAAGPLLSGDDSAPVARPAPALRSLSSSGQPLSRAPPRLG